MNAKQVAPPFVAPKPSVSEPEASESSDEVEEVVSAPVPGLLEAVQELDPSAAGTVSEQEASELAVSYWASGGQAIGGLTLGNKSPTADSGLAKVGVVGKVNNPFREPEPSAANPFATRRETKNVVVHMELVEPIGVVPTWNEFVKFVMEHGDHIRRVRFPNPPRNQQMIEELNRMDAVTRNRGGVVSAEARPVAVIDTVWKGIPVWNDGRCMIEHVKYGWAEWHDCQS
jgi:hypothetical protein